MLYAESIAGHYFSLREFDEFDEFVKKVVFAHLEKHQFDVSTLYLFSVACRGSGVRSRGCGLEVNYFTRIFFPEFQ